MLRPSLLTSAILMLVSSITALNLPTYRGLRIDQSKPGVLQIAFNNPDSEINVWGEAALSGLTDIVLRLQNDSETKAVVFTSDVPKYFIAHLDLLIQPFGKQMTKEDFPLLFSPLVPSHKLSPLA